MELKKKNLNQRKEAKQAELDRIKEENRIKEEENQELKRLKDERREMDLAIERQRRYENLEDAKREDLDRMHDKRVDDDVRRQIRTYKQKAHAAEVKKAREERVDKGEETMRRLEVELAKKGSAEEMRAFEDTKRELASQVHQLKLQEEEIKRVRKRNDELEGLEVKLVAKKSKTHAYKGKTEEQVTELRKKDARIEELEQKMREDEQRIKEATEKDKSQMRQQIEQMQTELTGLREEKKATSKQFDRLNAQTRQQEEVINHLTTKAELKFSNPLWGERGGEPPKTLSVSRAQAIIAQDALPMKRSVAVSPKTPDPMNYEHGNEVGFSPNPDQRLRSPETGPWEPPLLDVQHGEPVAFSPTKRDFQFNEHLGSVATSPDATYRGS
jgi:hypothetical protein